MGKLIFFFCLLVSLTATAFGQQYDLVIEGGRVIDPETGLDAVRNVGIRDGKIVRVSSEALSGRRVVHAGGLVVAPGFIDLHQHGQDLASQRVKALDGVTTALELEIGAPDVAEFLKSKEGHSLIHYGTSASHVAARAAVFGAPLPAGTILPKSGPATDLPATPEQIEAIRQRLRAELDAGGLAVGMGIQYTPGATRLEVIDMFRLAAERGLPVYTHMRSAGRVEPGSSIEAVSEVIGAAAITGAALHIVHINSTCLRDSLECLSMIEGARARGLDVTTEAYPYIAGMTAVNSALFNPGWREKLGIDYGDLVLPDTGEHLTKARFDELHNLHVLTHGAVLDPTTGLCSNPQGQLTFFGTSVPFNQMTLFTPIDQTAANVLPFFPLPKPGTNGFIATQTLSANNDQFGVRLDHYLSPTDTLNFRYMYSGGPTTDPLSPVGANVPGFPVGEDDRAQNFVAQETRIFSSTTVGVVRFSYLRNKFLLDEHLNHESLSQLGFQNAPTLASAAGPPFISH